MAKLSQRLARIPFVSEIASLSGNQRICIFMQPVWAIMFNLYAPYATLYMSELGLTDTDIGLLASISMLLQIFTALFGGVVIDKLGRRKATLIFDLMSWSVPCLLWAVAGNFTNFLIATLFAVFAPISANAITSLLVEDCEPGKLMNTYALWSATGYIAAFFVPISMFMVNRMGVISTVRILYFTMFILITIKFISFYFLCHETRTGKLRMEQTKGVPLTAEIKGYKQVLGGILHSPQVRVVLFISILINIGMMITGNFFALHITKTLGVSKQLVAFFPMIKSLIMLVIVFCVQRWLNLFSYRRIMLIGAVLQVFALGFLLMTRPNSLILLVPYIVTESVGQALLIPRKDSLITLSINANERARVMSLIHVFTIAATMPFGYIGGVLSTKGRYLPFVLTITVYLICAVTIAFSKSIRTAENPNAVVQYK